MRLRNLLLLLMAAIPTIVMGAVGDLFKAKTVEGVVLTFVVTSESPKTCQVGEGLISPYDPYIFGKHGGMITIPADVNGYSVTSVSDYAFYGWSGMTQVSLPSTLQTIGTKAFAGCIGLTSIMVPDGVTLIGEGAFTGCGNLGYISVSSGNTVYDSRESCNALIKTDENKLILGCRNSIIPSSVQKIGDEAFYGVNGLSDIFIPASVNSIGRAVFAYCGDLMSIVVDSGNAVYDSRDNSNAIIETVTGTLITGCASTLIPKGVTAIEERAFAGATQLLDVVIPEGVISIGGYAFDRCSSLTVVTIPSTVNEFGLRIFNDCEAITDVYSNIQTPAPIDNYCFTSSVFAGAVLYIPPSSLSVYKNTDGWRLFSKKKETGLSVTAEAGLILLDQDAMLTVDINNGSTAINGYQFDITMPEGISIAYDEETEDFVYQLSDRHPNKADMTVVIRKLSDNYYRCLCYSLSSQVLEGTEGTVISFPLQTSDDLVGGLYEGSITNVSLSHVDGSSINGPSATFTVQVSNFLLGDVNHDGEVNVADIMLIVNYIQENDVPAFYKECADINGDGNVDVADVMLLVSKIMNSQEQSDTPSPETSNVISVTGSGNTATLMMENPDAYTAFQMDVCLPEGATLRDAVLVSGSSNGHLVQFRELENGRSRIIVFALDGSSLRNSDNGLLLLSVDGAETSAVSLSNIIFTNQDFETVRFVPVGSSSDGIDNISTLGIDLPIYSISGQQVDTPTRGIYIRGGKKIIIRK